MEGAERIGTCIFREMLQVDVDALARRLSQEGVYIAQIKSENFARTFFRRQLRDNRLNIFVALHENAIVGWTVAIQDSRKFWKAFIMHHPFWGARIILRKLVSYCRSISIAKNGKQVGTKSSPVGFFSNRTVMPAGEVAAHLDITVLPQYRNCGVASKLQERQLQDLKVKGVKLVTASIAEWNSRSVRFHEKHGWVFHGVEGANWEISKQL